MALQLAEFKKLLPGGSLCNHYLLRIPVTVTEQQAFSGGNIFLITELEVISTEYLVRG